MDAKETLIRIVLPALLIYAALCLASARRELAAADAVETSLRLRLETIEQDNLAVSEKLTEGWSAERGGTGKPCAGEAGSYPAG